MSEVKRYRFIEDSDPDLMRAGRIYGATDGDLCAYADLEAAQSELAALREELAALKHPMNSARILRKELTAAEQRNAELRDAASRARQTLAFYLCPSQLRACASVLSKLDELTKPTESGASE